MSPAEGAVDVSMRYKTIYREASLLGKVHVDISCLLWSCVSAAEQAFYFSRNNYCEPLGRVS